MLGVQDRGGAVGAGERDLEVAYVGAVDRNVGDDVFDDDVVVDDEGDVDTGWVVVGDCDRLLDHARVECDLRRDGGPIQGGIDHADRVELTEAVVVVDRDASAVGGPVAVGFVDGLCGLDDEVLHVTPGEFGVGFETEGDEARGERRRSAGAAEVKGVRRG